MLMEVVDTLFRATLFAVLHFHFQKCSTATQTKSTSYGSLLHFYTFLEIFFVFCDGVFLHRSTNRKNEYKKGNPAVLSRRGFNSAI